MKFNKKKKLTNTPRLTTTLQFYVGLKRPLKSRVFHAVAYWIVCTNVCFGARRARIWWTTRSMHALRAFARLRTSVSMSWERWALSTITPVMYWTASTPTDGRQSNNSSSSTVISNRLGNDKSSLKMAGDCVWYIDTVLHIYPVFCIRPWLLHIFLAAKVWLLETLSIFLIYFFIYLVLLAGCERLFVTNDKWNCRFVLLK